MVKVKDRVVFELVKEFIRRICEKNSEYIVDILFGKKNVNEFKIAEKLEITINQTRHILYTISKFNVMEFTRKKDKKKGWYTYFWTLNILKALKVFKKFKIEEIESLQYVLKGRKTKNFYICSDDNIEMSEDTAMHHGFMCPECGQLLQPVTKEKRIKELTARINELQKKIILINDEIERRTPKIKLEIKPKKKKAKKKAVKKKAVKKKPAKKLKVKVKKALKKPKTIKKTAKKKPAKKSKKLKVKVKKIKVNKKQGKRKKEIKKIKKKTKKK